MAWRRLNKYVEMWEKPVLGEEEGKDGKRYMALCIDPSSKNPYKGIARQVTERKGNVDLLGYVDLSKLVLVESENRLDWRVVGDLKIKGIEKIIKNFEEKQFSFIGLEDPDIFVDENGTKHVYFTIAYKNYKKNEGYRLFLGHASGKSLDNLTATQPVISNNKEAAISPVKTNDYRYVLAESWKDKAESGISLLKAKNMGKDWEYMGLAFNPKKQSYPWCAGYASPCRIISPSITVIGNNLLLGICTGNSGEYIKEGKKYRGDFKPGLFLFNPITGEIPWIDKESLFKDPKATTITFASELVPLNDSEAILYAHPNDSFVRAYRLNLKKLRERIPKEFQA
jgi:hypothetical protein